MDMENIMSLRIRELRKENKITMVELAQKIGVTQPTITKWENGETKNIKNSTIIKLSKIFGVSPLYLLGVVDERDWTLNETHVNQQVDLVVTDEEGETFSVELLTPSPHRNNDVLMYYKLLCTLKCPESSKLLRNYIDFLYDTSVPEDIKNEVRKGK